MTEPIERSIKSDLLPPGVDPRDVTVVMGGPVPYTTTDERPCVHHWTSAAAGTPRLVCIACGTVHMLGEPVDLDLEQRKNHD